MWARKWNCRYNCDCNFMKLVVSHWNGYSQTMARVGIVDSSLAAGKYVACMCMCLVVRDLTAEEGGDVGGWTRRHGT